MQVRESVTSRVIAALAIGAAACVLVAGCSSGGDYPAVLDNPTPRGDTPMNSLEVTQATKDLISERQRLAADACSAQAGIQPPPNGAANSAPPATQNCPPATAGAPGTQTAGAGPKP